MTQNPPTDDSGTVIPPKPKLPPSGQELYDVLMAQIEPDLVSDQLPHLGDRYEHESQEQAAKRASRYGQAFLKFQQSYESYRKMKDEEITTYRKASFSAVEKESDAKDEADLSTLDTQFAT